MAQTVNGLTLYTNVDALGSVHDAQAGGDYTRDARRFDAFGGPVAGQGSDTFPLGFTASFSCQMHGSRIYGTRITPAAKHDQLRLCLRPG